MLVSVFVALASALVAGASRPAGADQVSDLRAQAAAVSEQLIQQQLEVGAYQQQYAVVSARVQSDGQAIAATNQQIADDERQIAAKSDAVRRLAIKSYMNYGGGGSGPVNSLFGGNQETAQAASEYSSIAVGNITTAVDQLHLAENTLQGHQTALHQQQAEDESDESRQAAVLGQANSTASHLASLQSQVTGQLAAAVAAQQAAQEATAVAAVTAADHTTKPAGPRPSSPPPGPSASAGAPAAPAAPVNSTDPSLNPFLQCVVQAESGGNYGAVSPGGQYMGAFQFSQSTWNIAAQAAGRPDLIGVPPNQASPADQDTLAVVLYSLDGEQPWLGDRCSS